MESNQIKWEAGDIAICKIVGKLPEYRDPGEAPHLRLNVEYVVNGVKTCECGSVKLDVGLSTSLGVGTRCVCGAKSSPNTGIHWAAAIRFVKKKTKQQIQEEIDMAIHDENYELAKQLSDEHNR